MHLEAKNQQTGDFIHYHLFKRMCTVNGFQDCKGMVISLSFKQVINERT